MPRFYFDFENGGTTIDDDGEEFPDIERAKIEAITSLGEFAADFTRKGIEGRLAVRIRDQQGPVLEVTAIIESKPFRK
jgi:hypothetical protein